MPSKKIQLRQFARLVISTSNLKFSIQIKIIHIAILIFVNIIHQEGGVGEDLHHFLVAKISHYFLGQIQLAKK